MNNLKKIGLTALAASLVSTSVFAGELAVSGSASIKTAHVTTATGANTGKAFSMGNSVTFSGGGELDNGMSVSVSFELDQGTADGTTSPFDSHSVTISSDAMGSLTFAGHGGDSAQSQVKDMTGKIWDYQGTSQGALSSSTSNNMMLYTLPTLVDGVSVKASYVPKGAASDEFDSAVDWAVAYTGVEGLTVGYAQGEDHSTAATLADVETMYAKYAYGSFTIGFQESEAENDGATTSDDEFSAMGITYQVSDDLTIGYHASERQFGDKTGDQESANLSAAYTSGGMTISAAMVSMDNVGGSTAARDDVDGYAIDIGFAF